MKLITIITRQEARKHTHTRKQAKEVKVRCNYFRDDKRGPEPETKKTVALLINEGGGGESRGTKETEKAEEASLALLATEGEIDKGRCRSLTCSRECATRDTLKDEHHS